MSADTLPAHSERQPLPVFPWNDDQVQEVADALVEYEAKGYDLTPTARAREALRAAARVMGQETRSDPMGAPRGFGWYEVRGVTEWTTVRPDGTWARG